MCLLKKIFYSISLLALASCASAQQEECIFDESSITDDFLRNNSEIQSYKWFDDIKVATVFMKTGEYVFIKKWACMSYGTEAKKIIMFPAEIDESIYIWRDNLLLFGRQFLSESDYQYYERVIKTTTWAKGKEILGINSKYEIDIPHDNYPEFYASIERKREMVILKFYYYMN